MWIVKFPHFKIIPLFPTSTQRFISIHSDNETKPHSHSNNWKRSQCFILTHKWAKPPHSLFTRFKRHSQRFIPWFTSSFSFITMNYIFETYCCHCFSSCNFHLKKNINIETIKPLRENTHTHTTVCHVSERSVWTEFSLLWSDHAVEEAVSKLYMAISKTWPFFL